MKSALGTALPLLLGLCCVPASAQPSLEGRWLLAASACSDHPATISSSVGAEYWRFTGDDFEQAQEGTTDADGELCRSTARGKFTVEPIAPGTGFRLRLRLGRGLTCITKTRQGAYTIRVPVFNRLTTYDPSLSTFRFERLQGLEALVEDVNRPELDALCPGGRVRYYFVRSAGS